MEINFCPRWLLTKLRVPPEKQIHCALLFSSLMLLGLVPFLARIPHICLVQTLVGIPCPGCGVLRAITALVRWDSHGAWRMNPAGIALAGLLGFQIVARPLAIVSARAAERVCFLSRVFSNAVLGSLFAVWIFRLVYGGLNARHILPKM